MMSPRAMANKLTKYLNPPHVVSEEIEKNSNSARCGNLISKMTVANHLGNEFGKHLHPSKPGPCSIFSIER